MPCHPLTFLCLECITHILTNLHSFACCPGQGAHHCTTRDRGSLLRRIRLERSTNPRHGPQRFSNLPPLHVLSAVLSRTFIQLSSCHIEDFMYGHWYSTFLICLNLYLHWTTRTLHTTTPVPSLHLSYLRITGPFLALNVPQSFTSSPISIPPLCPPIILASALPLSLFLPLPFPYPYSYLCPSLIFILTSALPLSSSLPCPSLILLSALPFPYPPLCPALPSSSSLGINHPRSEMALNLPAVSTQVRFAHR